MATRKSAAAKKTTSPRTAKARRSATTTSRQRSTRRTTTYRRRARPGLPTTIGSAIGMLVVTTLLETSWPVRIGLVLLVLVLGLAYLVWQHRSEITAGESQAPLSEGTPVVDGPADAATPTDVSPETTATQGDPNHE